MKGIAEFWAWWPGARGRIEKAIRSGDFAGISEEIAARVNAIDPKLDWELGPGMRGAEHAFCLSAMADPERRRTTERWLRAAPPPDATWEFHPARVGRAENLGLAMEIAGHNVPFEDLRCAFEVDEARERINVRLWHPAFPAMPEDLRMRVSYIALDNLLGEDGVERWLGAIDIAPADDATEIRQMLDALSTLEASATGERFAVLRGTREGAPIFVTANLALKQIDHLLCDMHAEIRIPLLQPTEQGLTTKEEADVLNALEDELTSALGEAAVYAGRETWRGMRFLHFFAPELGSAASTIDAWAARHRERAIATAWRRDPRWEVLARWS